MKAIIFIFLSCMLTFAHAQIDPIENSIFSDSLFVDAIMSEDYNLLDSLLKEGKVNVNHLYNGKTFVIYACIFNKPEIVRFLYNNGADIGIRCEDGYLPEDHANANNAIHALSEIVIIKA